MYACYATSQNKVGRCATKTARVPVLPPRLPGREFHPDLVDKVAVIIPAEGGHSDRLTQAISPVRSSRPHKLSHRLSEATMARIARAYQDGASSTDLAREYGISHQSVLHLLRRHGVEIQRQPLTGVPKPKGSRTPDLRMATP
jgi:hypothetical protein